MSSPGARSVHFESLPDRERPYRREVALLLGLVVYAVILWIWGIGNAVYREEAADARQR